MRKIFPAFSCLTIFLILSCCSVFSFAQADSSFHGIRADSLPGRWDEGLPLGNGMLGALLYEKDGHLRLSLDRADLWDMRPVDSFQSNPRFSYNWIYQQVLKKDYQPVQALMDVPYDRDAAPTKIPAGALEFPLASLGKVTSAQLDIRTAVASIRLGDHASAAFFMDDYRPVGHFRFKGVDTSLTPVFIAPPYRSPSGEAAANAVVGGQELSRLGYRQGVLSGQSHLYHYHQQGRDGFSYDVAVAWKATGADVVEGTWSITTSGTPYSASTQADALAGQELQKGFSAALQSHTQWWEQYWNKSSVHLPDPVLQWQYEMELYKFGAASRRGAVPITLQAIWTADNGKLPPWKGDFHNDLNTELSYWPGFTDNHLDESAVFTDWLWRIKPAAEAYTQQFYGHDGLNVPGVCTLTGAPMGGWSQYAFSPTISCWLAQYFYWQWVYTGDGDFLAQKAYPWCKAVAEHLKKTAVRDAAGHWQLPLSSSPEFFDNSLQAWFLHTTNYDLALVRWLLQANEEMAYALGLREEARQWQDFLGGWPELAVGADSALLIAPEVPYNISHRHFSHLMSIYPLQLLDWYHGAADRKIISASLQALTQKGTDGWCGYSYAWQACLEAMAQDGESAAKALRIFATAFCSSNSFHLNGDQSGKGYSKFTYRPFTLEGNFAFAKGVQLMLLQQHDGVNYLFPAVPASWKNVSFDRLRVPGAFLVSAVRYNGKARMLRIQSLNGGVIELKNPFDKNDRNNLQGGDLPSGIFQQDVMSIPLRKGQQVTITASEDTGSKG